MKRSENLRVKITRSSHPVQDLQVGHTYTSYKVDDEDRLTTNCFR